MQSKAVCALLAPRRQLILISWGFKRERYARAPLICGMASVITPDM